MFLSIRANFFVYLFGELESVGHPLLMSPICDFLGCLDSKPKPAPEKIEIQIA
jgi:hypothetical protein